MSFRQLSIVDCPPRLLGTCLALSWACVYSLGTPYILHLRGHTSCVALTLGIYLAPRNISPLPWHGLHPVSLHPACIFATRLTLPCILSSTLPRATSSLDMASITDHFIHPLSLWPHVSLHLGQYCLAQHPLPPSASMVSIYRTTSHPVYTSNEDLQVQRHAHPRLPSPNIYTASNSTDTIDQEALVSTEMIQCKQNKPYRCAAA